MSCGAGSAGPPSGDEPVAPHGSGQADVSSRGEHNRGIQGTFRLVEADFDRLRHLSKGTWYCRCGELATVERDAPECDICSAGSDCGLDCTVSRLSCAKCGATT
jgi:hypothetical protein